MLGTLSLTKKNIGTILGFSIALLGGSVLAGWFFEIPFILQVKPHFAPMQFNTALGFFLCGVALVLIGQEKFLQAGIVGVSVFLLGGLTLFEYLTGQNIGIDELFFVPHISTRTIFSGRMALNTAFCFTVIGFGLGFDLCKDRGKNKFLLIGLSGAVIISVSVLVLAGYIFALESSYGLSDLKAMAVHTASGFLVVGLALILFSSDHLRIETGLKLLFVIVLIVSILTILVLSDIREKNHNKLQIEFQTTLSITRDALSIWADETKRNALDWSEQPGVRDNIKELLKVPHTKDSLLSSPSIRKLDQFLEPKIKRHQFLGYIVIAPNYINIASLLRANVGDTNLLAGKKNYLQRAFEGEVLITAPVKTEVPLPVPGGEVDPEAPTMFVMAPVYGDSGEITSVIAFRLNPFVNFEPTLKLGRLGETGETYAFDDQGMMVSSSRYETDLRELGVLAENKTSVLSVELKDPGFKLTKNNLPTSFADLPFTWVVGKVVETRNAAALHEYRDYRGVLVLGVGAWIENLEMGIAVEVDSEEALLNYNHSYNLIVILLFITISLFFALSLQLYFRKNQLAMEEEKANKLLKAVEQSPNPIFITDFQGKIEYVNPRFCKLTKFERHEVLGKNPRIFKSGQYPKSFYENMWETIQGGNIWSGEYQNRRKDGGEFWVSASIAPMQNEREEISHFVVVWEDIAGRKELEKRLAEQRDQLAMTVREQTKELQETHQQLIHSEKLSAVGKLAASIAHEFNNPIFGIRSVLERIDEQIILPDTHKESVRLAVNECTRISRMIENLMDFNRPTSNEHMFSDIHKCVDEMSLLVAKKLQKKNILLLRKFGKNIPKPWIVPDQFKQVVLNLLHNAEESIGDRSGGKIEIITEYKDPYISISFYDNGHGIEEEQLGKVFDPFYTTKSAVKGTGLGLSVSYGIVTALGGAITAENTSEGCLFNVLLPAERRREKRNE